MRDADLPLLRRPGDGLHDLFALCERMMFPRPPLVACRGPLGRVEEPGGVRFAGIGETYGAPLIERVLPLQAAAGRLGVL